MKMIVDIRSQEILGIEEEAEMGREHRVKTDKNKKNNTPRTVLCPF